MTLAVLGLAEPACAQVGASISLQSDYVYRGRSLTEQRPAVTVSLVYDDPSGFYAGGALTAYDRAHDGVDVTDQFLYAGYATPLWRGTALDLGVSQTRTVSYRAGRRAFDYAELYAGVLTEHVTVRVHYAPDYYESGVSTLYIDAGATLRPTETLRLFARAGALTPVGGRRGPFLQRTRYDLALGVTQRVGDFDVGLTWSRLTPAEGAAPGGGVLVVGATYFF
ncbi:TorF family putative porin [Phenylobacterium sp.]|uniref:TorF family putative porin n=1 Tax=Phenylobacterium sp. TaxID=1871053 RepID=UPI003784BDE1